MTINRGKVILLNAASMFLAASMFGAVESQVFNQHVLQVLGASAWHLTLMVSTSAVMGSITSILFGVLSDNWKNQANRRKPFILWGGIGCSVFMILFIATKNFWACYIIDGFVIAFASNAFYTGQRVIIAENVPIGERGKVNGIANAFFGLGFVLFAILMVAFLLLDVSGSGGDLFARIEFLPEWVQFWIAVVSAFVILASAMVYAITVKEQPASYQPARFRQALRGTLNIQALRENGKFSRFFTAYFVLGVSVRIIAPYIVTFIATFGFSLGEIIIFLLSYVAAMIAGNVVFGKCCDLFGRKRITIILVVINGFTFVGAAFAAGFHLGIGWIVGFMVPALFTWQGYTTTTNAWSNDLLPEDKRTSFLGILNLVFSACQVPGVLIGASIYETFGIAWVFLPAGIWALGSFPLFFRVKETFSRKSQGMLLSSE
ncbi:MAG: MFS transporter [Candidatus Sigynarchaeum springense]